MLYWALVFLVVALIAAIFGFGGIAGAAAGIAKLDQSHDVRGQLSQRLGVGIALRLPSVIGSNVCKRALVQCLADIGHELMCSTPRPVIGQLLVDRRARLACEVWKLRPSREPLLAVAGDANLLHLGSSELNVSSCQDLQYFRGPGHLRNRCRRRAV